MPALPPTTHVAEVHLAVHDLERSVAYYGDVLGLRPLARDGPQALLGADRPILRLTEEPQARPRPRGTAGLFHAAYLLPARADLARFVARLAERRTPVDGASDHLVSEAVYLTDPDGHGIEVYADRPREAWPRTPAGIAMATNALDVRDLIAAGDGRPWSGAPAGTVVGHVHLNVADVARAEAFYRDVVGFDKTAVYPGASFLAAGGYHHHVAVNVWNPPGAPAPADALGLRDFTLAVPDAEAAAALRARLRADGDAAAADPAGNRLRVAV